MKGLLFIIGCPRSGKTTTHDILASSGRFAWISNLQESNPREGFLSVLNKRYDIPFFGLNAYLKKKNADLTAPVQGNDFWKDHLPGFEIERFEDAVPIEKREAPGLKTGDNISEKRKKRTRKIVEDICKWHGKDHFLSEYALWSRMNFFSSVFPEARFVHVIRDGRTVAHEYRKMIESGIYPEKEEMRWWMSGWPREWREEYEEKFDSLLAFCAFQWKFILKMIWEDSKHISEDRYLEIRYEDIVEDPKRIFSEILEFYGLKLNHRIERYIEMKNLEKLDSEEELDRDEKRTLDRILNEGKYAEYLE